jgi:hypothetical protein
MKKNYLLIGAAVLAAYYFFLRKPKMATTTSASPVKKSTYPAGLMEGDYVKFGLESTVYVLLNGQKLPASKAWWDVNVGQNRYEMVKNYPASVGLSIPTGNTL